ncbi:MAG: MarR family winged helix-turn-helix transcriptional regulator [Pseudonocardiaceae bacterium]
MNSESGAAGSSVPSAEEVEAVMLAARVLVAVTAQSMAALEDRVTLPQFRVLVIVASRGPSNLVAVAQGLGVHPSNATRACDRLVSAGLLDRRDNPDDRRNLVLELTAEGQRLVEEVTGYRRSAIEKTMARMPVEHRGALATFMGSFAEAAGEVSHTEAWMLGWTTERPRAAEHERVTVQ